MQTGRLPVAVSLLTAQSAMAADALTRIFRGDGHACCGTLFLRSGTIEWSASFFKCGSTGYKIIEQDLSDDHPHIAFKIEDRRGRCDLTVIEISRHSEFSWSIKDYPAMKTYQKREEPGQKDSADPACRIALCSMRKEQRSERIAVMQPLQRSALGKHRGPYKQWPIRTCVVVDGVLHPTLAILGYELLRQYQTDLGFVLIINYDCPFEETVSITLVAPDLSHAISTGTVGAAYYTFWLDNVEWIDVSHFYPTYENTTGDWLVTLRARYIPVLPPAVFIKRRVAPPAQPAA